MADRRTLRAFVAFELPGRVLDSLSSFQKDISASGADIKLVERANLHFTVKFLGEITEGQGAEVDSRLKGLALKAAHLGVQGVGAFPSLSRPRVVWAGVSPDQEGMFVSLAQKIIGSLEGIGERDERPFQPHVTLARVRSGVNASALQEVIRANSARSFGEADIIAFKLKSSQLTPRGPIYRDVGVYSLN
jgi:RNA 2',3'-cyclic 3'-phosphodiesterase